MPWCAVNGWTVTYMIDSDGSRPEVDGVSERADG